MRRTIKLVSLVSYQDDGEGLDITYVAVKAMMFEFATWWLFIPMSPAMTSARRGGKATDVCQPETP